MKTTATAPDMGTSAAGTLDHKVEAEPIKLLKRIGSTTFIVNVHFSNTSTEPLEDKIHRLIQREVEHAA